MQKQFQQEVKAFMLPFIELSSLSNAQFPILPNTYTLWRKVCYKNITQKYKFGKNSSEQRCLRRAFFQVSQRSLFTSFIDKIKSEMDARAIGWRKAILQEEQLKKADLEQYRQLLVKYSEDLYLQELYIEMFYDLVSIPYSEIYVENKTFQTNQKFKANFYKKKNQTFVDKVCNKLGKSIVTKGLGKLSQAALSKWMVYGMTGIVGGLNPLGLAASFSINYAMDSHQKYSKVKQITSELQYLASQTDKNIKQLQQIYDRCLCSLQAMLYLDEGQNQVLQNQRNKFCRQILSQVLIQDWLQIKVHKQGQWQIIQLRDKYSGTFKDFQDIQQIN